MDRRRTHHKVSVPMRSQPINVQQVQSLQMSMEIVYGLEWIVDPQVNQFL